MADFDLTQTDAQVQSILNDAQDAQGAGAQTTLTTDYIMLKGTNGRYHKILKDSFTEAVRNVLSGLLVNNDKGTTISQIPAISSGDFGSVTPANLASVLGGAAPSGSISVRSGAEIECTDLETNYKGCLVAIKNSSYTTTWEYASVSETGNFLARVSVVRTATGLSFNSETEISELQIYTNNNKIYVKNTSKRTATLSYKRVL
jgi:hypothetical protein